MQENNHTKLLSVGLSPWIQDDGNYWNGVFHGFYIGQITTFALEFHPYVWEYTEESVKSIVLQRDSRYTINGQVVFCWQNGWIVDFGYQAYAYRRSAQIPSLGSFVTIDAYLGVDHFAYCDQLYSLAGMLPLIYTWKVQKIVTQTIPLLMSVNEEGKRRFEPDKSKCTYNEVEHTGEREPRTYEQSVHYILSCCQMDNDPTFRRTSLKEFL